MILKSRFIEYLFGCCPGRLLNVLCTFNLGPVFMGYFFTFLTPNVELLQYKKQGLVV